MSHWPGPALENYLTDALRIVHGGDMASDEIRRIYAGQAMLTVEQFAELVAIAEPHREAVERRLDDYSEDENGSWRDYRNYVVHESLPFDVHAALDAKLASFHAPTTLLYGQFPSPRTALIPHPTEYIGQLDIELLDELQATRIAAHYDNGAYAAIRRAEAMLYGPHWDSALAPKYAEIRDYLNREVNVPLVLAARIALRMTVFELHHTKSI